MAAFRRCDGHLIAALASLALAACGAREDSKSAAPAPAAAGSAAGGAPTVRQPAYVADHIRRGDPYWVSLLKQSDGGVIQQAPQSVFRYSDRTAEIWIQILHPAPLTERFEEAETIEDLTFQRERYRYLFDCARRTFTVTERQIMGVGDTVVRTVRYEPEGAEPQWREISEGGPAGFLLGPACIAE